MVKLPNRMSRLDRWLQSTLVALFFGVAAFYSVTIPPGEGVDEIPHFDYVRYVKENGALPIQPMNRDAGVTVWMGHHPPLYYVLGAAAISWTDTSDWNSAFRWNPHFVWQENLGANGWSVLMHFGQDAFPWQGSVLGLHVMRLLTVAFGAIAVYAIFAAARLLFAGDAWLAAGATAVMAFNPSFVFMSSTIHHDTLQAAIFALGAWWLMTLFGTDKHSNWYYVAGGLLGGAAALTKLSGLTLIAVIALALCLKAIRDRDLPWLLKRGALTLGVIVLVDGWWYIRNQLLYGDPLGWRMFLALHNHMVRTGPYTWFSFKNEFLAQIGRTFWGGFGYMHITFPELSRYLWYVTAVGVVGLIPALIRKQINLKRQWAEWIIAVSLFVLLIASFVRFSIATVGAGHGRYLFPAAFTMGALIMAGLRGFSSRRLQPVISLAVAGGMLAYAIYLPLARVMPKYAPPETITAAALPEQATIVNLPVAQGVELTAYRLDTTRAVPGQTVPIALYWKATGESGMREDPQVRLVLLNENEYAIDSQGIWPVPGLSPDVWPSDKLVVSRAVLYVPAEETANELRLRLTPILRVQGQVTELDSRDLASLVTAGGMSQVAETSIPHPRQEVFASEIRLRGYGIGASTFTPGATAPLELYWEALQKPTADYTVFVHLLNQAGEQVSGFDRPAGGPSLPTSAWQPSVILRDVYPLTIPGDLPTGKYTIRIGMYTWPSLARLPIAVGKDVVGDSISLTTIQIRSQ